MQEPRSNFLLVVREKFLYAIGGDKEIDINTDSVEMYKPDSNSWRYCLCHLPFDYLTKSQTVKTKDKQKLDRMLAREGIMSDK